MEYLKQIKKGSVFWITAWLTMLFIWTIHAVWMNINSVSSWDTLTETLMNNIINNQKDINTRLDSMLWVWQTRQDVTSSRQTWIVYTNNTWKPIIVSVITKANSGATATSVNIVVDWKTIWRNYNWGDSGNTDQTSISAIVPNWSKYKVNNSVVVCDLSKWHEFR